ncbi:Immunoglobulin domain-containing protein oig-1 [Caenorhabditis elegans]|uniref:Immunoglobulin domain-containing protein oig-1 n=1 Tax=Caenorhabditis elegans TaxID=6239 RepID=OIG1_CAEEL|nr:Immunoglobulin domain-containing protein oig-1 [Caenorhabditis elegans]Q9N5Z2.1 RecName: Full=Immunoglobulin domain-containing protein oig-1; Flags: Precursor [Caenorhabditis elegans]CCD63912.1 Immunoglobulin domain-containing protein oig-1 [Caenorhabditis elegans]|eukprot:NP_498439.1 Immunoglobulin domain-containing protein oig-1 [Caenorhabditis elegans]
MFSELRILRDILLLCFLSVGINAKSSHIEDLDFTDHTNGSPKISRSSYFKQDFRLGYKLKLFCESSGNPRPQIVWYHRGVEVNPDHNRTIRFSIHGDTVSSHLEVDPTSIGDKGEYECVATNLKGSRVKKFLTDYQY